MVVNESGAQPDLIGGCYRVEAELGQGGMARVYRVVDERSGQRLALKQLSLRGEHSATLQAMFEREYHSLVQLAHPRIVGVFDYGLDADRPYYTMELLQGADSRETLRNSRLGVGEVCMLLRDAASALALIHSRRMVHRDVGPRNLWCMPDGRAKLIDFGTLVAMGPQSRIAGTPPYVPPEAVYSQPLDARCDLYALGALAYYLLTGRNAYPAREIADLRHLWQRRPKPPDALKPELPAALSDLVMSLMSLDPRARPASAAEVFDRLTAIGELPAEDERHLAQAFLTSPTLVGREEATAFLRKRLLRASRGRGNSLAVVAASGLGRSRMLASFVLEAKLMGSAVITADATAVEPGPFALAAALAERLLELQPMVAAAAVDIAPVLGHVSPALHRALGEPALCELTPLERGHRLSSALVRLVEIAARQLSLVIAVDDVHRSDSASLGVLAKLSLGARDLRLLLVTSCDEGTLAHAPPALQQLVQAPNRIDLEPLDAAAMRALVSSLFGAVPGLSEAASWLHELSQGSPQACMQYAQFLVDRGIARYQGGHWQLPPNLREQGLPATLGAMLEGRLAALSEDARSLALGLALARDESRSLWQPENHVRIEDFPKLLADGDAGRAFLALDELLCAGIVQQRDRHYVLGQRAMVDVLMRVSGEQAQRSQHARLAQVFAQSGYQGQMLTVRHLQCAGEHLQARASLVDFTTRLASSVMDWGAMRVSVSAQCALTALAHFEQHGGTPREGILLRRSLLLTCSVYDWSAARFGDQQLAQLRADCGLAYWDATDAAWPPLQRLIECMQRAQQEFERKPEAERGFAPVDAVRELGACAMTLGGAFANSHDVARARALPALVEPLRPLSPLLDLIHDMDVVALTRVTGRELGDGQMAIATRLQASTGLPEVLRTGGAGISAHIQAVEDARRGRVRVPDLLDMLLAGVGEEMFLVVHGRWLAHAFGGRPEAERFRRQVEVITEDDVWRRKTFLFVEAQLHALTGDLLALQRVTDQIAELAQAFDGWRPWLAYARAAVHTQRGELAAAAEQLAAALAQARPGEHRAWVLAAPAQAELLLQQGDAPGAVRAAEAILQAVEAHGLDRSAAIAAERVRALAESRRDDHDAAQSSLERAFALARELDYGGLPLAQLYEAQARIAITAGKSHDCLSALTQLRTLLEHADAPARVGAYEMLREDSTRRLSIASPPSVAPEGGEDVTESSATYTEVRTRLTAWNAPHERAQQALTLLLEESGAGSGHLFLFDELGMFAAASKPRQPSDKLLMLAKRYLDAEIDATQSGAVTVPDLAVTSATTQPSVLREGELRLLPVLLSGHSSGRAVLTGLALLVLPDAPLRPPRHELVRAISRCLDAAGDSLPVRMDG